MLKNLTQKYLRNLAVIAHVDHGKTTLVNSVLEQCGKNIPSMDTLALEQERGITILSKVTAVSYKDYLINFVDTPGHADFGGQVERVMNIVDGVLLVVCATEGPMPQTRYVLSKALEAGHKPIVVLNKLDRSTSNTGQTESKVFDLFCSLNVSDEQLEYPVLYASGKDGWVDNDIKGPRKNCFPLIDQIIDYLPPPKEKQTGPFKMLVSMTESSQFFGKFMIGKVHQGQLEVGQEVTLLREDGTKELGKVTKIQKNLGLDRIDIEKGIAGDIITVAGVNGQVNDTLSEGDSSERIPPLPIDPPTITLRVRVNDSPFNGTEGKHITLQSIKKRLFEEAENDLALQVVEVKDCIEVSGRGELHLGILLETLRREGYEFAIEAPMIVTKEEDGEVLEPIEEVTIEVPSEYSTAITEAFMNRLAGFVDMKDISETMQKLVFHVPTRAMMGFKPALLNITKGNMSIESFIHSYDTYKGELKRRNTGILVAAHNSTCTEYGISHLEEKGVSFVTPGAKVYEGMLIGETTMESEMVLNPGKEKKLTNIRAAGKEDNVKLSPHRTFTIEEAFAYINEDELVEITPKSIRLRKKELNSSLRKRDKRSSK